MKTAATPEQLLQEGAPCRTRFLPSVLIRSTRVLSHMTAFSPSTSSLFHAPSSPVFSLNNTSHSNQINHLLSTYSPGGLFGECGTIFLSLYLLLKPSSGEQWFLSVQHYKQSIWGRAEEKEKPKEHRPCFWLRFHTLPHCTHPCILYPQIY